jgi:uncharacterized protein (TIGR02597 family)
MTFGKIGLMALSFALFAPALEASTTVSTVGYGYKIVSLPANGIPSTNTYVSQPLTNPPVYSAGINAFTTTTLSVAGTPWTAEQFATAGSPYFVEITSGLQAGRFLLITDNTTSTLTVDITDHTNQPTGLDASLFSVVQNDSFRIVPGETLASFLGDNSADNPLLIRGGTSPFATTVDTVGIYHPNVNTEFDYYFNTTLNAWTSTTQTGNQNGVVLAPDTVVNLNRRRNAPAVNIMFVGNVPDVAPLTKVTSTAVIYGSTRLPVDLTLGSLSLSNWTKSNSQFSADSISLWNSSSNLFVSYYQGADSNWHLIGDPTLANQNSVVLPGGTGFQIKKRASVSGAGSYISQPLPTIVSQ